ncbi:MAG: aminopeptidase [Burkholderiales bacterium]|nr:aminopeptidase [Burkholderiales bacterium]
MEVTRLARPVEEVLADPAAGADLKRRLAYALRAREFATRELGLPENASYRRYADLGRPFVVWNVFAAPALSLELRTQCFPVAGCVVYRGFFAEAAARRHADGLRAEGLDVFVGGVPAYSTLGWFADPLLNTFIRYPDLEIARLIFHELAHQVAYVRDDSAFNESFAVAVEEEGLRRWAQANAAPAERAEYEAYAARRRELLRLFARARRELAAAYAAPVDDAARRAAKARILARVADDYAGLRREWNLPAAQARAYDAWVLQDLNNAKLGSIATYTSRVPQFAALLAQSGGDIRRFHREAAALAALPREERNRRLDQLGPQSTED